MDLLDSDMEQIRRMAKRSPEVRRAKERASKVAEFSRVMKFAPLYFLIEGKRLDLSDTDKYQEGLESYFNWIKQEIEKRPDMPCEDIGADIWRELLERTKANPIGTDEAWNNVLENLAIEASSIAAMQGYVYHKMANGFCYEDALKALADIIGLEPASRFS